MSLKIVTVALAGALVADAATGKSLKEGKKNVIRRIQNHLANQLSNKLVEPVIERWPLHYADLDNKTLATTYASGSRTRLPFHGHASTLAFKVAPSPLRVHGSVFPVSRFPLNPSANGEHSRTQIVRSSSDEANTDEANRKEAKVLKKEMKKAEKKKSKAWRSFIVSIGKLKFYGIKHYMPLVLTFAIVFGLSFPSVGQDLATIKIGHWRLTHFCVAYIFFVQGALLKIDEVKKAVKSLWPLLYGIATALLVTPLLSFPILALTFLKKELLNGFVLFCNMPTTKSSGIAMVSVAGGSFSFALLIAIITNVLGVFTIPFMLSLTMSAPGLHIDPFPILRDLVSTILLPTIVGKVVGMGPGVMGFFQRYKRRITISTLTANAFVPMLKVSQSADAVWSLSLGSIVSVIVLSIAINFAFIAFNFVVPWLLRYPVDIRKSLILMCSQKTLPTAMAVLASLPDSVGNHGTVAIPCILFHFTEVIIGSLIAGRMASWRNDSPAAVGSAKAAIKAAIKTPNPSKEGKTQSSWAAPHYKTAINGLNNFTKAEAKADPGIWKKMLNFR